MLLLRPVPYNPSMYVASLGLNELRCSFTAWRCVLPTDSVEEGHKVVKTAIDAFGRIGRCFGYGAVE